MDPKRFLPFVYRVYSIDNWLKTVDSNFAMCRNQNQIFNLDKSIKMHDVTIEFPPLITFKIRFRIKLQLWNHVWVMKSLQKMCFIWWFNEIFAHFYYFSVLLEKNRKYREKFRISLWHISNKNYFYYFLLVMIFLLLFFSLVSEQWERLYHTMWWKLIKISLL